MSIQCDRINEATKREIIRCQFSAIEVWLLKRQTFHAVQRSLYACPSAIAAKLIMAFIYCGATNVQQ